MNERAAQFLDEFVSNEIHPAGFPQDKREAEKLAEQCRAEARSRGIGIDDVEAAAGMDLVDYMSEAIENAVMAEVERQVEKDRF